MTIPRYVLDWARLPGPAKVLHLARARLEAGGLGPQATLAPDLTRSERLDVGKMLDAVWAGSGAAVSVRQLRQGLATHSTTLEDLVVATSGPLRDLPGERAEKRRRKQEDRDEALRLLSELPGRTVPTAVLERCLTGAEVWSDRARDVAGVVEHLDQQASCDAIPIRLGVLAASLFSDAHALDRSRVLGRAVARFLGGRATAEGAAFVDPVGDAAGWHAAWESAGVVCDAVSGRVLVLNLPLTGDGPAAQMARVHGEPVWLTLRSLRQEFGLAVGVDDVYVCENPAILEAAADRFGDRTKPLVCTFGNPDLAAITLLESLAGRTRLHVRADGDKVGWQIVERLLRLAGAEPRRMPSAFDRYEEEILDDLLDDLVP